MNRPASVENVFLKAQADCLNLSFVSVISLISMHEMSQHMAEGKRSGGSFEHETSFYKNHKKRIYFEFE